MNDKEFNQEEVEAIFQRAAEAHPSHDYLEFPAGKGLTLPELREIGREAGLSSDAIDAAATAISAKAASASKTAFGFPIGVSHSVQLDRKLSAEEWDRLVVELRETFDAKGTVRQDGSLRQWTNGNLQALLEPTSTGDRIRLRTTKGEARGMMLLGLGLFGGAVAALIGAAAQGVSLYAGVTSPVSLIAIAGIGVFSGTALGLPRWARMRKAQMKKIADDIVVARQRR